MVQFDSIVWLLLGGVAGSSVLGVLHVLARRYERERSMHDLRARVIMLRRNYANRLAEIAARESQVELVPESETYVPPIPISAPSAQSKAA